MHGAGGGGAAVGELFEEIIIKNFIGWCRLCQLGEQFGTCFCFFNALSEFCLSREAFRFV